MVRSEGRVVDLRQRRQLHDAGIVHQHVDAAIGRLGGVEQARHGLGVADVGLEGHGPAAGLLNLGHQVRRGSAALPA